MSMIRSMRVSSWFFRVLIISIISGASVVATAQNKKDNSSFHLLGTRSWIRVSWNNVPAADEYRLYWSNTTKRPENPDTIVKAGTNRFYIQDVQPEKKYKVWLAPVENEKVKHLFTGDVTTQKIWQPDPLELKELQTNPSSVAVPKGMEICWQDEFNDGLLNRNKWFTNYYSNIDYLYKINFDKMKAGKLPQPAYTLNGKTINLFTNDSLPREVYDLKNDKKISSIQTYDWGTNENLLDNSRGGYFEVKVKRSSTGKPRGLNTAFWFDSPGPDLRYYLQQGTTLDGVHGVRPKGQVFEIDVFEYLNAQFVLHGHVDSNGVFQRNLNTHIAEGYRHVDNWVVHGMLWTPTSVKHYINGNLIKEYTDKNQVYSPNHFMNVLLGSYGGGGTVNMEVDYIRYYNWPLKNGNELPNPGFEDGGNLAPWEGDGSRIDNAGRGKTAGVQLKPGQKIAQYVYLNNDVEYELAYCRKGKSKLSVSVDNIELVTGKPTSVLKRESNGKGKFIRNTMRFRSGKEFGNDMKTIRIELVNIGSLDIYIDDVTVKKCR
ncbi:MAG: glycoside hydrolase family 16 protein [Niabella sp.]